jgi:hypothetical protein
MLDLFQRLRGRPSATPMSTEVGADPTRTLDALLRMAVAEGASDLHCEPKEDGLLIRFRLDGEMRDHTRLPLAQRDAFLARGKIFGGMDITEKRLPQDGRAVLRDGVKRFHLRLSTVPTVHGESLVIRLLDQSMPAQAFGNLGFLPDQAGALDRALHGPAGLIYLTGPTGSGKTTTLHAALHALDHHGLAIHTLEDPVEYEFPAIRQTEIREKIGLSFATALRALLRQILMCCSSARRGTRKPRSSRFARPSPATLSFRRCTRMTHLRPFRGCATSGWNRFSSRRPCDLSPHSGSCGGCAPSARPCIPKPPGSPRTIFCRRRNCFARWAAPRAAGAVIAGGSPFTR